MNINRKGVVAIVFSLLLFIVGFFTQTKIVMEQYLWAMTGFYLNYVIAMNDLILTAEELLNALNPFNHFMGQAASLIYGALTCYLLGSILLIIGVILIYRNR